MCERMDRLCRRIGCRAQTMAKNAGHRSPWNLLIFIAVHRNRQFKKWLVKKELSLVLNTPPTGDLDRNCPNLGPSESVQRLSTGWILLLTKEEMVA